MSVLCIVFKNIWLVGIELKTRFALFGIHQLSEYQMVCHLERRYSVNYINTVYTNVSNFGNASFDSF